MVGINRTENRAGCVTVEVFLHYFLLVSWMWMGAEALLLFQKLVIVLICEGHYQVLHCYLHCILG